MRSTNPAFENSLACLQHPLTLLSIAVLLINDHVLKVISPSWLTGKLSDLAGLFFFPFILAAGLSLVLSKFHLPQQRVGQIAFGIVAVWFVLIKTSPFVNMLTAQFASLFIGAPAQIILDPTDLIALVVLLPGWRLWIRPARVAVTRRAYASLAVGVIACLASMPPLPPFEDVVVLAYQDGNLYARSSAVYEFYYLKSMDHGNSWEMVWAAEEKLEGIRSLPIRVCDPVSLQTCYQIDGTDKVSISQDGGKSWEIAWEISPERREYVAHVSGEIATYDLIVVREKDSQFLFVARGKNGILRRQLPDGEWVQLGVRDAEPAPLYAANLLSVYTAIRKELIIWLCITFLSLLFTHVAIWKRFRGEGGIKELIIWLSQTVLSTFVFILVEMAILLGLYLFLIVDAYGTHLIPYDTPEALLISILVVVFTAVISAPFIRLFVKTDQWIRKTAPDESARPKIVLLCVVTVICVLFFGASPWPLWAMGVIERYQWALLLSISISILITALGYYLIRRIRVNEG